MSYFKNIIDSLSKDQLATLMKSIYQEQKLETFERVTDMKHDMKWTDLDVQPNKLVSFDHPNKAQIDLIIAAINRQHAIKEDVNLSWPARDAAEERIEILEEALMSEVTSKWA